MGLFLFTDRSTLVNGWVNFPVVWPHTPVQTKLKRLPPPSPLDLISSIIYDFNR